MVRKGYVDLADGQLHFRERPGATPPLIFLHQTALSSRSFEQLLGELALRQRLLAIDLPGFGQSFRPAGWPTMRQYADWVCEALDRLDITRAHFFGHHTGACIATDIAHRHPERVASLMLCAPVCFTQAERDEFRESFRTALAPVADGSHLLQNWRYTADHNAGASAELLHDQVVDMLTAWRARPQAYVAVADYDFESALRALHTPTQILTAPGDYFESHIPRCQALRPDIGVVTIGGGNLAPEVDYQGTARVVELFLSQQS